MFVTNHVLSGVLIGRGLRRWPVAAFVAGVGSHLVLDAIPHWGCNTMVEGGSERFLRAARTDGLLGLAAIGVATLAVDRRDRPATMAAMAGAALLDLDKPFLHFLEVNPFPKRVIRLHMRIQNESEDRMPNEIVFGVVFTALDGLVTYLGRREGTRSTG